MARARGCLLLLQVLVAVAAVAAVAGGMPSCNKNEYGTGSLCCLHCPAGSFVRRPCGKNHTQGLCEPCEPGTHIPHPSGLSACFPCRMCRPDQQMVTDCNRTTDRQCHCKKGVSWDSGDSPESCRLCTRCENNQVVRPCTPTSDTQCANITQGLASSEVNEGSQCCDNSTMWAMATVATVVAVVAVVAMVFCLRRGYLGKLTEMFKRQSQDPRSSMPSCLEASNALLSVETEGHEPVLGVDQVSREESSTLAPAARTHPGPADSETSPVPQPMSPEQAPQPQAAPRECMDQSRTAVSLEQLEQEFGQKYIVNSKQDTAVFKIHHCFEEEVDPKHWNVLMRCIGLEENDITICETENPGNVREQHMKMLFYWRQRLGSKATVFRLVAALYRLRLDMALENFINKLVTEGVLQKRAAGPDTDPGHDPGPAVPRTPVDAALGPLRPAALTPPHTAC